MNENNHKHYIIYKITNKINNKFYIGMHQTSDLDDGYMGSGVAIKEAIEKYGIENFIKEILYDFTSFDEMNAKEAQIVNKDFIDRHDTYNLSVGGTGGWENCNKSIKNDPEKEQLRKIHSAEAARIACRKEENRKKNSERLKEYYKTHQGSFTGKKHSEQTKLYMSLVHKGLAIGKNNGRFGTHWWKNPNTNESKCFLESESPPAGWIKGRYCNFSKEAKRKLSNIAKNAKHNTTTGYKWITNKKINKMLNPTEDLPDGWIYGKVTFKEKYANR